MGVELFGNIIETLDAREVSENNFTALCPIHDDQTPSLSICLDNNKILFHCHAGCETEEILDFLDLTFEDLFAEDEPTEDISKVKVKPLLDDHELAAYQKALTPKVEERLFELRRWSSKAIRQLGLGLDHRRVVIPVEGGVLRYSPDGSESPKMLATGSPRVIYDPQQLDDDVVWLVEGEPDTIAAISIGLNAWGLPGVSTWKKEWEEKFRDKKVYICFDADAPGRKAALKIFDILAGVAENVRIIDIAPKHNDGYDLTSFIKDGGTVLSLIAMAKMLPSSVTSVADVAHKTIPYLKDLDRTSLSTGFSALDKVLGGLRPNSLVIVAARPGVGKTTLVLDMVRRISDQTPTAFFSLEMGSLELSSRLLAAEALVPQRELHYHNGDLSGAIAKVSDKALYIDDKTYTIEGIMTVLEQLVEDHGVRVVVIDYLQLLSTKNTGVRHEEVASITRSLKLLAMKHEITIIACCQLNREESAPLLSRLRESGSIEQDADSVVFIERKFDNATLKIEKNRHGPSGEVSLTYESVYPMFS